MSLLPSGLRGLRAWPAALHRTAVENARGACVEASRRRVERAEVDLYVAQVARRRAGASLRERAGAASLAR